jgi:hypothetical protein
MRVLVIGGSGSFSTGVTEKALERGNDRAYACDKVVARLGHAPLGTPQLMLDETVRHMLDAGLVKDAAEQPFDDALVELLMRQAAELGELLARRAAASQLKAPA